MKSKRKSIVLHVILSLITLIYVGLLWICENTWIAWLIIGISVAGYIIIKRANVVKKTGWIALALVMINAASFGLTNQISLVGGIVSKLLVPMMAPEFAKEMLLSKEDSLAANQKLEQETWNQDGYYIEKLNVNDVKFEKIGPVDRENDKVIMEIHGGGFVVGLKNSYRDLAVKFSKLADGAMIVLSDYTTSEKAPYPAALNDCVATYQWILDQGYQADDIIVVGDSAGGNLALALGLYLRDQKMPLPGGIITISAFANMKFDTQSYEDNADKCVLGKWFGKDAHNDTPFYYTDRDSLNLEDPYLSPVYGEYQGFPKLLMQVGSREIVLDDSKTITSKVNEAGGDAVCTVYHGMWHVFQIIGIPLPEADQAWDEMESFIHDVWKD